VLASISLCRSRPDGLDYPIRHKVVATGGCQPQVLRQLESLHGRHPDLNILKIKKPMGEWLDLYGTKQSIARLDFMIRAGQAVHRGGTTCCGSWIITQMCRSGSSATMIYILLQVGRLPSSVSICNHFLMDGLPLTAGALRNFSADLWKLYDRDPKFCLAFFRPPGPDLWTAFAFTRRALRVLGFFDENIYPAYYEVTRSVW
jgi:hypothetical protein